VSASAAPAGFGALLFKIEELMQVRSGPTPPDSYYDAVNASNRWFSTGIFFAILSLLSLIPTQYSRLGWLLVGLFAVATLFCFTRFVISAWSSGHIWRTWRKSHPDRNAVKPNGWAREFVAAHPIISGNVGCLLVVVVIVLVLLSGFRVRG
jgi:hypothetical protein